MSRLLNMLANKMLGFAENAVLGIICLHEMGLSPREYDSIFHFTHPGQEEARLMAGIVRLKDQDPKGKPLIEKT